MTLVDKACCIHAGSACPGWLPQQSFVRRRPLRLAAVVVPHHLKIDRPQSCCRTPLVAPRDSRGTYRHGITSATRTEEGLLLSGDEEVSHGIEHAEALETEHQESGHRRAARSAGNLPGANTSEAQEQPDSDQRQQDVGIAGRESGSVQRKQQRTKGMHGQHSDWEKVLPMYKAAMKRYMNAQVHTQLLVQMVQMCAQEQCTTLLL